MMTHLNLSSSTIVLFQQNYVKRKMMREHFRIVIVFLLQLDIKHEEEEDDDKFKHVVIV